MPATCSWPRSRPTRAAEGRRFETPTRDVRLLPGVGDHGGEGGNVISCPVVLLAEVLGQEKPDLAANLLGVWQACGSPMHEGNYAAEYWLFGRPAAAAVPPLDLKPRRMPGWGMIFRDAVGTDREFYLAFHAGCAAYRDDGFGSGLILHALGRPLSLDGGDNTTAAMH